MIDNDSARLFYDAVLSNNQSQISKGTQVLRPIIMRYLMTMMKADINDAEDIVQNVFLYTINQISSGGINEPDRLGAYLIKAARNQFISFKRKIQLDELDDEPGYFASLSEQIDALVEEEKLEALRACVDTLEETNKSFMQFWLAKPDEKAEVLAKYFDMTVSYVFTKKHRLIKVLAECVKFKLDD